MGFAVDKERCTGCGICAADCVCGIIAMQDGVPVLPREKEKICVHCGHCAAVCPHGALTKDSKNLLLMPEREKYAPDRNRLDFLLKGRRACRQYTGEPVTQKELESAIEYAGYAPTAHNFRQVSYVILNGREKVLELLHATACLMKKHGMYPAHVANAERGTDTLFRGAPCLVLACAPERLLSEADCATALAYLELSLHAMGLASCWAGMLIEACAHGLPEGLEIPAGCRLYGALMAGHPKVRHRCIPFRSAPRIAWL